jgi:hypothetical protein
MLRDSLVSQFAVTEFVLNFGLDWELGPYLTSKIFMKSSANLIQGTWRRLLAFWPGLIFRNVTVRVYFLIYLIKFKIHILQDV